jgi:hypothetical protein
MGQYLDSIPPDINSVFFDNAYVNNLAMQRDVLIEELFGDMAEDVFWFLYEFEAGKSPGPHLILADGIKYTFVTDESYYEYLKSL